MSLEGEEAVLAAKLVGLAAELRDLSKKRDQEQPAPPVNEPLAPTAGSYARSILKMRQRLREEFSPGLFVDPAFEVMLDLFARSEEGERTCVKSATIASGVPPTTALRWLDLLRNEGLICRRVDPVDGRRVFIELTATAHAAIRNWLQTTSSIPLRVDLP